MDGINSSDDVIVIAATNYPWELDDAVLSRFTSKIFCDFPNKENVFNLMKNILQKKYPMSNNIFDDFKSFYEYDDNQHISLINLKKLITKHFVPNKKTITFLNNYIEKTIQSGTPPHLPDKKMFWGYSGRDISNIVNISISKANKKIVKKINPKFKRYRQTYYYNQKWKYDFKRFNKSTRYIENITKY